MQNARVTRLIVLSVFAAGSLTSFYIMADHKDRFVIVTVQGIRSGIEALGCTLKCLLLCNDFCLV